MIAPLMSAQSHIVSSTNRNIAMTTIKSSGKRMTGLRILLVTARYFPYLGGTETHVYEVGRRMAAAGNEITILTTNPSGELPAAEQSEGLNIVRVRAYPADRDYYFAPGVYRTIMQGDWHIVHCQGYHTLVAPLAMFAALRSHTPYVVTFHSGGHSSRFRNMARTVQWEMLRPLLIRAARLIGVSNFEADFFSAQLRIPRQRFTVIQNGASLTAHAIDAAPCNDGSDNKGEVWIVSVGRLERYKGHQSVIAALPRVLEQHPEVRLRIVGSGPHESALRHLVADLRLDDKVVIGAIPPSQRGEMAALLSRAALVTLLSEYEAHPVAVMEALSLARPVLVTDTAGLRELAEGGLARSIPLESTSDQIADAILAELDNPLVPFNFALPTWEDCTAQIQQLYLDVLAGTNDTQ
jgi:glycosyltransferase involved in cell wall biosynthesis